jgi:hypothetical protein
MLSLEDLRLVSTLAPSPSLSAAARSLKTSRLYGEKRGLEYSQRVMHHFDRTLYQ